MVFDSLYLQEKLEKIEIIPNKSMSIKDYEALLERISDKCPL